MKYYGRKCIDVKNKNTKQFEAIVAIQLDCNKCRSFNFNFDHEL